MTYKVFARIVDSRRSPYTYLARVLGAASAEAAMADAQTTCAGEVYAAEPAPTHCGCQEQEGDNPFCSVHVEIVMPAFPNRADLEWQIAVDAQHQADRQPCTIFHRSGHIPAEAWATIDAEGQVLALWVRDRATGVVEPYGYPNEVMAVHLPDGTRYTRGWARRWTRTRLGE